VDRGDRWMPARDGPVARIAERCSGRAVKAVLTSDPKAKSQSKREVRIAPGPGAKPIK
jgi:hypothetical protein